MNLTTLLSTFVVHFLAASAADDASPPISNAKLLRGEDAAFPLSAKVKGIKDVYVATEKRAYCSDYDYGCYP